MSHKLVCNDFRTESFRNGDSNEWNRKIDYVNELVVNYELIEGVKDLFYSLLQTGTCYSASEDRIVAIQDVLIEEGYVIDEVK